MLETCSSEGSVDAKEERDLQKLVLGCVAKGDFTLSSGRKSDFYVDARKVTLTTEGSRLVGLAVLDRVRKLKPTALGGPATAACPMISAAGVLAALQGIPLKLFYVRSEPKKHGTMKAIEGAVLGADDTVLLVDDVVTSGGSLVKAAERVRDETKARIVGAVAIVDREEGGRETLERAEVSLDALFCKTDLMKSL
jgi:orotate phosphoribosyltransferase